MDSKQRDIDRVYEDFEPTIEWETDSGADTLKVYLPGFRKEQMKAQVTTSQMLRIGGERQINENEWSRFLKEIPISSKYDTDKIKAIFEKGILFFKLPKFIPDNNININNQPPLRPPNNKPPPPQEKPPKPQPPTPPPPPAVPFKPQPPPAAATGGSFKPQPPSPPAPAAGSLKPQKSLPPNEKEDKLKPKVESLKPEKPINEIKPEAIPNKNENFPQKENEIEKKESSDSDIKEQNLGDSDKTGSISASHTIAACNYRELLSDMVKELKSNPRAFLNSVMAAVMLLLLRLYAMITKAFRFFRKSDA